MHFFKFSFIDKPSNLIIMSELTISYNHGAIYIIAIVKTKEHLSHFYSCPKVEIFESIKHNIEKFFTKRLIFS